MKWQHFFIKLLIFFYINDKINYIEIFNSLNIYLLTYKTNYQGGIIMIYNNIVELIGNTPVVKLNSFKDENIADIYVK